MTISHVLEIISFILGALGAWPTISGMMARKRLRSEKSILAELKAIAEPDYIGKNVTSMRYRLCAAFYCMGIAIACSGYPSMRIAQTTIGLAGAVIALSAGGKAIRTNQEGVDGYQKRLEGKLADLQRKKQIP